MTGQGSDGSTCAEGAAVYYVGNPAFGMSCLVPVLLPFTVYALAGHYWPAQVLAGAPILRVLGLLWVVIVLPLVFRRIAKHPLGLLAVNGNGLKLQWRLRGSEAYSWSELVGVRRQGSTGSILTRRGVIQLPQSMLGWCQLLNTVESRVRPTCCTSHETAPGLVRTAKSGPVPGPCCLHYVCYWPSPFDIGIKIGEATVLMSITLAGHIPAVAGAIAAVVLSAFYVYCFVDQRIEANGRGISVARWRLPSRHFRWDELRSAVWVDGTLVVAAESGGFVVNPTGLNGRPLASAILETVKPYQAEAIAARD